MTVLQYWHCHWSCFQLLLRELVLGTVMVMLHKTESYYHLCSFTDLFKLFYIYQIFGFMAHLFKAVKIILITY